MAATDKVFNSFKNCWIKRSQAQGLVEQRVYAWDGDRSIRKLSLEDSWKARAEDVRLREPLAYAEIFGLTVSGIEGAEQSRRLASVTGRVRVGSIQKRMPLWTENRQWLIEEMQ